MNQRFGEYDLEHELGRGAMGVVYKARHRELGRVVALKLLISGQFASEKEITRFRTEAKATASLNHPGIVRVYDVGEHDGKHFLSMQYIEGNNLADVVRNRSLPQRQAAEIVAKIADAVAHAHQQGILHRDLKPANILLDEDNEPHVTDFGLAKHTRRPDYSVVSMTESGAALGTPSYMSPEQASGNLGKIREATDVYGIGAILYELVTGFVAFKRATPTETIKHVVEDPPYPPTRLNRGLDKDLETICLRCLEKSPDRRYQSATDVADELKHYLRGEPIEARPISRLVRTSRWCWRHRTATLLGTSAIVFLLTLALIGLGVAIHQNALREEAADLLYDSNMEVAQTALESSNLSRVLEILKYHREDRRRGFEWYYLWRNCRRTLQCPTLVHEGAVWGVAFSPDGDHLVTGTVTGELSLWDERRRSKVDKISCGSRVTFVAYSPEGDLVAASCGDGSLRIWDMAGRDVRRLEGHQDKVWRVAFSPNGRLLVSADTKGQILVWDLDTWESERLPSPHVSDVWGVAFSGDSSHIVSAGSGGQVLLWNVASRQWRAMPDSPGSARSVAISPDDHLVAAGHADGRLSVWDLATDEVTVFSIHSSTIWSLQFTSDGERLVSSSKGVIRLSNVATGQITQSILGHESSIFSSSLSPDGRLATASHDGLVKIWDLKASEPPYVLIGHTDPVTSVAMRGESLASASQDHDVRVWNLRSGEALRLEGHGGPVWDVNYLPDGRLVSVSADRSIIIWDVKADTHVRESDAHKGTIRFVVLSPDNSLMATGGDDEIVRLWSTDGRFTLLGELAGHKDDVQCAAFVQRGTRLMLATGSDDRTVLLWDLSTKLPEVIMQHASTVWSLAVSLDGQFLVSGGMDGKIQVYYTANGKTQPLQKRGLPVHAVFVAPQGDLILSGGLEPAVKIWDAETYECRASLRGHTGRIWGLCSSEDERLFASGSGDATIRLWRAATERDVAEVKW